MKKRILAAVLGICIAGSLSGCSESQLSNEYITITQYKGLEVAQVEKTEVTDDMVESEINSRLYEATETEEITDRASQDGDTVNIDFAGSVDGVEFEGGTAAGVDLVLGSGAMIGATENYKGFEEQLVGHNPGDKFTITVQFPEEYSRDPEMAGKVADFAITLNSIKVSTTPELTDDWVAENSEESKNVEEYKKEVKKDLEELYEETAQDSLKKEAVQALAAKTEVTKLPENQVEAQKNEIRTYYESQANMYSLTFADYLGMYMGMTEETFDEQAQVVAEDVVTQKLAIELVAKKKRLEPTEEEYQKAFEKYVETYGFTSVDAMIEQVGEDTLKQMVVQDVVGEYLVKSCVQVEATEE